MKRLRTKVAVAAVGGFAGAGLGQDFEIYLVAPQWLTALPSATYTVEVWGRVTGEAWIDGVSAIASFGIDIFATRGRNLVNSVRTAQGGGGGIVLTTSGVPAGPDLLGVSGGQLANLFGFLNPNIDLSNPIRLFTFEVTVTGDWLDVVEYTPMNPAANGGLGFYPDSTVGTTIIAPNDAGTTLTLTGARSTIISPSPGTGVVLGTALLFVRRRR